MPVFNDKHLSWNWDWAKSMVDTARELGFPLMAGSSLPVTWRIPSVDLPWGAEVDEVVCVGYGGIDSYDFHGLESLQCLAERRRGGETGVVGRPGPPRARRSGRPSAGGSGAEGAAPRELVEACLCRSFTARLAPARLRPRLARDRGAARLAPAIRSCTGSSTPTAEGHAADALRRWSYDFTVAVR